MEYGESDGGTRSNDNSVCLCIYEPIRHTDPDGMFGEDVNEDFDEGPGPKMAAGITAGGIIGGALAVSGTAALAGTTTVVGTPVGWVVSGGIVVGGVIGGGAVYLWDKMNASQDEPLTVLKSESKTNTNSNNSTEGARRKNRLPDVGDTTQTNKLCTTIKVYGQVQKEYNKGYGPNAPKNEQKDHVHDHKPKPSPRDPNATDRKGGRKPKRNKLEKDRAKQNNR